MIGKEDEPQKPTQTWVRLRDENSFDGGGKLRVNGKVCWVPVQMPEDPLEINVRYLNVLIFLLRLRGLHLKRQVPPSNSGFDGDMGSGGAQAITWGTSVVEEKPPLFKKSEEEKPDEVYLNFAQLQEQAKTPEELAGALDSKLKEIISQLRFSRSLDVTDLELWGEIVSIATLGLSILMGILMKKQTGEVHQSFLVFVPIFYLGFSFVAKLLSSISEPLPLETREKVAFNAVNLFSLLELLYIGVVCSVLLLSKKKIFRAVKEETR